MTPERDVRDRLAEALWKADFGIGIEGGYMSDDLPQFWRDVPPHEREEYFVMADWLLPALPSVGLTPPAISTDAQDDGGSIP